MAMIIARILSSKHKYNTQKNFLTSFEEGGMAINQKISQLKKLFFFCNHLRLCSYGHFLAANNELLNPLP